MFLAPPDTRPEEASNTCDWGNCNGLTTSWRWGGPALMTWLPVCHEHRAKTHAESVQELAKEFRRLAAGASKTANEDGYSYQFWMGRYQGLEHAAQMLEEKLNG